MADLSSCLPLSPDSIRQTHERIRKYIHRTPVVTSRSLDKIASSLNPRLYLSDDPPGIWADESSEADTCETGEDLLQPKFNLYFKLESVQRIGAFKARGAFSAITHLIELLGLDTLRQRGVITHSSGNHAQALALAASTYDVPAFIVMPTISTKSKISGTKGNKGVTVIFSGSTAPEREKVVSEIIEREKGIKGGEGPILVPPYDHVDIALGQGTAGMEMEEQFQVLKTAEKKMCSAAVESVGSTHQLGAGNRFDAVLTPLGGGGLLSGTAIWYSHTADGKGKKTMVFGAEPWFQGGNDGERGLAEVPPRRIEHVRTLTIADGVRTPIGVIPWSVISDKTKLEGVYSVSELEIKMALKLVLERMKMVIEPSSAVPLAVVLFNQRFRDFVAKIQKEEGTGRPWDVGIIVSGGNTTVEALSQLYAEGWMHEEEGTSFIGERETGQVGVDGSKKVEDVAG